MGPWVEAGFARRLDRILREPKLSQDTLPGWCFQFARGDRGEHLADKDAAMSPFAVPGDEARRFEAVGPTVSAKGSNELIAIHEVDRTLLSGRQSKSD
jgi:hypothetical protein